jgi:hypothetical protein
VPHDVRSEVPTAVSMLNFGMWRRVVWQEDTHIDGGSFTPGDWATPISTDQKRAEFQSRYEGKAEAKISSPTENRATFPRAYSPQFIKYTNYTRYKVSTFNLLFTVYRPLFNLSLVVLSAMAT